MAQTGKAELSVWISERLVSFRESAGLDQKAIAEATKLSLSGIAKMESPNSNPTIENLDLYVQACGRTLGEFFEPWIPADNPRYDRYVHRVVREALEHPTIKQHVRGLIGLLTEAMK